MNEIAYIGEHLLPGQIGHFCNILGFVASLLAVTAFFFATQKRDTESFNGWRSMGRFAFLVHGFSVFMVIGTIFYIMVQEYFEYQYAWAHVSSELPSRYILSAFWEGQEGSFLLWMFWHIILGFVLIFKAGKWESPVLTVLALIQVFIGSMILGLHFEIGETVYKLGSSPLLLLRDVMDAPIFAKADYVSLIEGSGLNPLLQNYWMTIHPPTLFLGFASTAIPFCYAIAGLWTKQHKAWLKPVMPWALFSGAILGTGILMGGAWAYEALSFGGYWAWDPVENMSLVPWILLVAGIHTNLIARSTNHSIKSTYIFYLLTFIMIVYSTFLTRSGVLGDSSVHAFTEMGLETQLIAFLFGSILLGLISFLVRLKGIPSPEKEENTSSKEFWIFIGSLVLFFSAILITVSTSLPVYNKIREVFDPTFEGFVIKDPVEHFNQYQMWIAVFVALLSGSAQFLRFKEFNWTKYQPKFVKHIIFSVVFASILTFITTYWIDARAWQYIVLLFTGFFSIISNLDHIITFLKGNLKIGGSAISHIGFGIMIIGVMASGLNKKFISTNAFAQRGLIEGFTEENYQRNILLMKGVPMLMSGYEVTYVKDSLWSHNREFTVNYKKRDKQGEILEEFDLYPNILYDKTRTKVAASNPSTKRYLTKDIFTHVASLPRAETDPEYAKSVEDSLNYKLYDLAVGDTVFAEKFIGVLESVNKKPTHHEYESAENDIGYGVKMRFYPVGFDSVWVAEPMLALRQTLLYNFPIKIDDLQLKVRVSDKVFERVFTPESELNYKEFVFKKGEKINLNGHEIMFKGFNLQPGHPNYKKEDGDIAVGAILSAQSKDQSQVFNAEPLYLIRNSQPFNLKDEIPELGLHFRFTKIDPNSESIEMSIGIEDKKNTKVPIEIADNALRTDYIVMEAILFPGINLFWLGTIMIMLGLTLSMFHRMNSKKAMNENNPNA